MLHTRITDSFTLDITPKDALKVCRKAVADLGWRVLEQSPTRMRCKEVAVSVVSFNWPAEVEIVLSGDGPGRTSFLLNGTIFMFGPVQRGHLQGQMGNLRNRIELAVEERVPDVLPPDRSGGLVDELNELDGLRKGGALTEEEFRQAKARLLQSLS